MAPAASKRNTSKMALGSPWHPLSRDQGSVRAGLVGVRVDTDRD